MQHFVKRGNQSMKPDTMICCLFSKVRISHRGLHQDWINLLILCEIIILSCMESILFHKGYQTSANLTQYQKP